jgi:holo-[acyl-carrier protein] synthase
MAMIDNSRVLLRGTGKLRSGVTLGKTSERRRQGLTPLFRVGVDIVRVDRIESVIVSAPAFTKRYFSPAELQIASQFRRRRRMEFFAGRLAVKEAAMKAFGVGIESPSDLREIETLIAKSGQPLLQFRGKINERALTLKIRTKAVSISHDAGICVAFVVLR